MNRTTKRPALRERSVRFAVVLYVHAFFMISAIRRGLLWVATAPCYNSVRMARNGAEVDTLLALEQQLKLRYY